MAADLTVMTYSIYKLTFAPYMEELIPGKLSKAKLKKLVSCVLMLSTAIFIMRQEVTNLCSLMKQQ